MIFDLDGTLVQTERLKAISYAQAARELRPDAVTEDAVIAAFKDVVGLSRNEVATALVERFRLAGAAEARMAEFGVSTPWQAYIQLRLRHYDALLADPAMLRRNQWPHTVALLHAGATGWLQSRSGYHVLLPAGAARADRSGSAARVRLRGQS
ncbi:MAG: hypothetical protein V9H69_19550 [Anaerolineae bacterium]